MVSSAIVFKLRCVVAFAAKGAELHCRVMNLVSKP
jgi:hypothetical protein